MIRSPAGFDGFDRIKRYQDYYQAGYGVMMLSAGQFSPLSLFAAGEQGAWYDPSDFNTMFQDSAGTTPVTAVEQPVGLLLDKRKGLVLGSELLTNGDFSSGTTGWTASGAATLSTDAGRLKITSSSSYAFAYQALTTVIGRTYKLTYSITNGDATACYMYVDTAAGLNAANFDSGAKADGTYSAVFVATATTTYVKPFIAGSGKFAFYDNISARELPGNHASQSTAASRPVLSARVNLLTYSEQFDNAAWVKFGLTTTGMANTAVAPHGTTTADSLINDGTNSFHGLRNAAFVASSSPWTYSAYFKAGTLANVSIAMTSGNPYTNDGAVATFDLSAGTVSKTDGPAYVSSSITSVGNGWYKCSVTASNAAINLGWIWLNSTNNPTYAGFGYETFAGTAGQYVYSWGADLRATNDGVGIPAYQRVAAATDYDTSGFPMYLRFDGTDDSMATLSIDFTATDKMSVFAGVRKLNDATGQLIAELGDASPSGWYLYPGNYTNANGSVFTFLGRGNAAENINQAVQATGYASPLSAVLTATGNISGAINTLKVSGVAATNATGNQGTGNYGNLALNVGRRNNASLPFNGRLYSLIVCGAALSASQIASTEAWVNGKTGAY